MSSFTDELIQHLDDALSAAGQNVTLRRSYGTPATPTNVDVVVRVHIRGFEPREVGGEVQQQDQKFILSPTQIDSANWPGIIPGQNLSIDNRIPRLNDYMLTTRGTTRIQAASGLYVDNVLVRIEGQIRGT